MTGFILTLTWPLVVVIRWDRRASNPEPNGTDAFRKKLYWGTTFAVCTLLLLVKPMMGMEDKHVLLFIQEEDAAFTGIAEVTCRLEDSIQHLVQVEDRRDRLANGLERGQFQELLLQSLVGFLKLPRHPLFFPS